MKLFNLFTAKGQVNNSLSGDCNRLKQDENEALCAISGGRSMVEMLGVLAIIGVLSVGAISGYNTAMYKYRMNKTVQTVTDAMQNVAELSTKNWREETIADSSDVVKYGLLPASMCPEDYVGIMGETGLFCKLPLGEIYMLLYNTHYLSAMFYIVFYEGDIVKSCVDFLSHGWQNMYPQEWLRTDTYMGSCILVGGESLETGLWAIRPDTWRDMGLDTKTDNITLSDIQIACDACKESEYCTIIMVINDTVN